MVLTYAQLLNEEEIHLTTVEKKSKAYHCKLPGCKGWCLHEDNVRFKVLIYVVCYGMYVCSRMNLTAPCVVKQTVCYVWPSILL